MSILTELFKGLSLASSRTPLKLAQTSLISIRFAHKENRTFVVKPKPGNGKAFRRIVHYPEEYTVEPLKVTNLAGRDPVTGRKVCEGIGGGIKHKYHWIKWMRDGPSEGPPKLEKVIRILQCGCRTAHVALVADHDEMKYILATENMKPGDIIKTSKFIPENPLNPNEGDAHPLGALSSGTKVHNIQIHPTSDRTIIHAAGSYGIVKYKLNDKVVVQLPSKQEIAFEPQCMATIGRLSNVIHSSIPIGSPNRLRELGYRPRSGWKHRKTGRFGRKIRRPPPVGFISFHKETSVHIQCSHPKFRP